LTWSATERLLAYPWLVAGLFLAGIATGRPELIAVAAPFAAVLIFGLARSRTPHLSRPRVSLVHDRVIEGDTAEVKIEVAVPAEVSALEVGLAVPRGVEVAGCPNPAVIRRGEGAGQLACLTVRPRHWGVFPLSPVIFRAHDGMRLRRFEAQLVPGPEAALRVYPRSEHVRTLTRPARTNVYAGNRVSAQRGDGVEFADVRPFASGDRVRSINWRASARRGSLWINQRHPEHNADIVLLLDTFTHVGPAGAGSLEQMVRGASALAAAWLRDRDRVGIVGFGGTLRWLEVGEGLHHAYRIVDALLDTQVVFSYAWKGVEMIPARLLPPHALVVGITPLLDPRSVTTLLDLRGRGFDVAVVEISPEPWAGPITSDSAEIARRIWMLEREVLRSRFLNAGLGVAVWREGEPIEPVVAEVEGWRRRARLRFR